MKLHQQKPEDTPETQKKLQVAETSRDEAILIFIGLNFHDAYCNSEYVHLHIYERIYWDMLKK